MIKCYKKLLIALTVIISSCSSLDSLKQSYENFLSPASTDYYLVKSGDSIWSIALALDIDPQLLIKNNKLTQGHAKILVGLENAHFLAKKIIEKNLSVRQAENLVKIFKTNKVPKFNKKDPNIKNLELSLIEKIGLNVLIKNNNKNAGSITLEYKNLEQLNKLIEA